MILHTFRLALASWGPYRQVQFKWPPKAFYAEAIIHYSTIHMQHKYAHTILKLFVKCYCCCVYTAVSVGYSMCYHITMKLCLEL